jgi:hypothetical protein
VPELVQLLREQGRGDILVVAGGVIPEQDGRRCARRASARRHLRPRHGDPGGSAILRLLDLLEEDRWRELIAAQERSGLGVRAFAESRGLAPATMYWWRCRLRDRRAALVPVAVVDSDECPVSGSTAREPFELALGAMTLRIPAGFDEHDLRRLVRALRC